jgi:glycosyltransferase involved in cell wall biosynthesis
VRVLVLAPLPFYIDRGSPIDVDILVRALCQRGEAVDLVVYREGEDRSYPGLTIYRAAYPSWLGHIGPGFSIKKLFADLWFFALACRLAARQRYDIVHAGEEGVFVAMWLRFRRRLPYVYDMDSSIAQQMVEKNRWLKPFAWFFNWCEARAIRGAVATAPVCNALADLARERGARHVATLHDISQLDPEDFATGASIRERFGLKHLILLYVGNLERYQGVDLLLEAFRIAAAADPCIDLVIAGGTPQHIQGYARKAAALGIGPRTHFVGPWPAKNLGALLIQADVLVAPRLQGINTPQKVFPYLHSGRAVLATDLPTHTQILNASVCELAAAEPKAFAGAILRLAANAEYREELGRAGRRFVEENHTFSSHQSRVDQLYAHVSRTLMPVLCLAGACLASAHVEVASLLHG